MWLGWRRRDTSSLDKSRARWLPVMLLYLCDPPVTPTPKMGPSRVIGGGFRIQKSSGARDLNPGPHGPESHDSSSKHVAFCVFQFDSSSRRAGSSRFARILSPGVLHERLQNAGR